VPLAGLLAAGLCLAGGGMAPVHAQAQGIYSCVDAKGRRITSDRPIRECLDRQQQVLNRDGSQRQVVGPSMTAEERAVYEEAERARMIAEAARRDAVRQDRNLMARYRNEDAHRKARDNALEPTQAAIRSGEHRLQQLAKEREQLDNEAEFYRGREMPRALRQKFEQNDTAAVGQRDAIEQHRAEMQRINALYDDELARLRRLWAGALPGSLPRGGTSSAAQKGGAPVSPASSSAVR
jgi:Domain of unknown function (DUF4124)